MTTHCNCDSNETSSPFFQGWVFLASHSNDENLLESDFSANDPEGNNSWKRKWCFNHFSPKLGLSGLSWRKSEENFWCSQHRNFDLSHRRLTIQRSSDRRIMSKFSLLMLVLLTSKIRHDFFFISRFDSKVRFRSKSESFSGILRRFPWYFPIFVCHVMFLERWITRSELLISISMDFQTFHSFVRPPIIFTFFITNRFSSLEFNFWR